MKTRNLIMLAVLSLSFATAYAQSEEQVLNSDPINVDGYLAEDKPVTDGELESIRGELRKQKMGTQLNKEKAKDLGKLTNQTEKLLESQDEYIDQKIESTEAIKEFNKKHEENQRKLRCIMEESDSEECEPYKSKYSKNKRQKEEPVVQEVQIAQAAPAATSTEEVTESFKPFEKMKFLPYVGATTYSGEVEKLESELSAGMRIESNINERFAMGIGFNYAQLKTNDFANGFYPYMNAGYMGAYGAQGREINFNTMGVDLYGKFFITNGERFRPYVGVGLGYNRASMKYTENNPYMAGMFGNEEFRNTYATGTLMAGSQIMITRAVGLNLEAAYSSGLGNSMSSKATQNAGSPDQYRLKQLGEEIINANALSIFAGMVVIF